MVSNENIGSQGRRYRFALYPVPRRTITQTRSMSRKGHSPDNAACEGFFGRLKVKFFRGRDWSGWTAGAFIAELSAYIGWYREGRLKAFREGGRTVYDTIRGRRARLEPAA